MPALRFITSYITEQQCSQVTGEATYTDDVKLSPDFLHGALVASTRPFARILSVDPSEALKVRGSHDTLSPHCPTSET